MMSKALTVQQLNGYLNDRSDKLAAWCKQSGLSAATLRRVAVKSFADPKTRIQECTAESIYLALTDCAQLGLEPTGGISGEGYLVAYKQTCVFMPGFQGLIKLIKKSPNVLDVWAYAVYAGDRFEVNYGTAPAIVHVPSLTKRGDLIASYAVAEKTAGRPHIEVLTLEDITKIRAAAKKDNIWSQWTGEMARKSAVRRLSKYLPKSPELQKAVDLDTAYEVGNLEQARAVMDDIDPDEVIDVTPSNKGTAALKAALADDAPEVE